MRYMIGVDFGGGASKATLLDERGRVAATASREYPTRYPASGWAEQDPEDSYSAMAANIRELLDKSGVRPGDVAALALDGATHTAVLLGEGNALVRPAIYWTDTRSTAQAARLRRECGDMLMERCYNVPSSFWTLPQLMWLREWEPENHARIRRVLSMKDYVRYRLTGDFVTDSIEAMGFLLLDARSDRWSEELMELAGLRATAMPEIVDPSQILSPLCEAARRDTGLTKVTRVIAGATDTAMEVYASGAIRPGQATVKLATAGRICAITDRPVVDRMLVAYRHVVPGLWYPGTATRSCASSLRWYRDVFGGDYRELDRQAAEAPIGSDGLFFHPYLQGEITPYLDDSLRAGFTGATGHHARAHFNRAVLEGVAYSMLDCFEVLRSLNIAPDGAAVIGGGAKSPLWRQILSDMLGIPLSLVENVDSSLGSAMLAGVAAKVFASHADAVEACVRVRGVVEPNAAAQSFYADGFRYYKRIQAALAPIYRDMRA